jgi:regulator of replication initiation timing
MANVAELKRYATELGAVYSQIEDLKLEAASLVESAKVTGINTKALVAVAKELQMEHEKLEKRLAQEEQLDLFRNAVGLLERKGLKVAGEMEHA